MVAGSQIAPHILTIALMLSLLWGRYLIRKARGYKDHHDARSMTELFVAVVPFTLCFSYVLRTGLVLFGMGSVEAGIVVFFSLLAPTVVVGIWVNLPERWRL